LTHLDRAHEFGRFEQGFVRSGVELRIPVIVIGHSSRR